MIVPPTFGMYKVSAKTYGVEIQEVPLTTTFQLDVDSPYEIPNKEVLSEKPDLMIYPKGLFRTLLLGLFVIPLIFDS